MFEETKGYKIYDRETGLFMTANSGWDSQGKMYNSLKRVQAKFSWLEHIDHRTGEYTSEASPSWEIIEFIIKPSEERPISVVEMVEKKRRKNILQKKYGNAFTTIIERIEEQNLQNQFKWILASDRFYTAEEREELETINMMCNQLNLKHNKDFKKAVSTNRGSGFAFAFADKKHAAQIRLAIRGNIHSVDISDFVEMDEQED